MDRIQLMMQVTQTAGAHLRNAFGQKLEIRHKSELDLVTLADESSEKLILDQIHTAYPNDAILAEESGRNQQNSEFTWVIDPLDGTTNFAQGLPHFAVSVGLMQGAEMVAGAVFDPIKGEFFHALKGAGSYLNGDKCRVSAIIQLKDALVVTGFPYDRRTRLPELLARVERVFQSAIGLRRLGAAALDLAYVASGRLAVFYEDSLNPWDLAAGSLLVQEAGGVVLDFSGNPCDLNRGEVVAGNAEIVAETLKTII